MYLLRLYCDAALMIDCEENYGPGKTLDEFREFIQSSSHLTQYIRALSFQPCMRRSRGVSVYVLLSVLPMIDLEFLDIATVTAQLPALQTISLNSIKLGFPHFTNGQDLPETLLALNVKELYLWRTSARAELTTNDFFLFLSAFPHLTTLSLQEVNLALTQQSDVARADNLSLSPLRCLKKISILNGFATDAGQILCVAEARGWLPALDTLAAEIHNPEDLLNLQALFDRAGGQLSVLRVHYIPSAVVRILNAGTCAHKPTFLAVCPTDQRCFAAAAESLSFAPCTGLAHLTFCLWDDKHAPNHTLWPHILRALAHAEHFPALRTLTFEYHESLSRPVFSTHCKAPLAERHADAIVSAVLAVPTLQTVVFRPPDVPACDGYREVERSHLRTVLAPLDWRGMLVIA